MKSIANITKSEIKKIEELLKTETDERRKMEYFWELEKLRESSSTNK